MKLFKYSLLVILLGYFMSSCDSLDLAPEDWYGSESFWVNESQVQSYILGLHSNLRDVHFNLYLLGEARGGTQKSGTSFVGTSLDYSSPIKTNQFTKDLTGITNWGGLYSNILKVNILISKVENECDFLPAESKNYYLGQAYGLRAFYYFLLYRTFGGLPLVKEPTVLEGVTDASSLYLARSSAKETMDFIKSDLQLSEDYFGSNLTVKMDKSLWSKYATLMLKSEVYLWSGKVKTDDQIPSSSDINIAKSALNQIIGSFELMPNFNEIFDYDNKGNPEIIFAIRFIDGESTNSINLFLPTIGLFNLQFYDKNGKLMADTLKIQSVGTLRHEYKWGFFAAMDENDTRKYATFLDCYDENGDSAGLVLRKFLGIINSNGNRSLCDDYVVYRYADALLMMAEVENQVGGDVAIWINEIRKRAFGENYDAATHAYVNGTYGENELAILKERDKEFVWEGKRWFDLIRLQDDEKKSLVFSEEANYDDPSSVINPSEAYKLLWPIDVNTLNKDPELINNEGYE